jgi:hypothetical protein
MIMVLLPDRGMPDASRKGRTEVIIDDQRFYLSGPIAIDPASDFAQGIKTGPTSFDQRLHSFFIAVDDYSAGIGYDRVDVREDIGLYATSELGADTRRSKHMHAPPYLHRLMSTPNSVANSGWLFDRNSSANASSILNFRDRIAMTFPGMIIETTDGVLWRRINLSDKAATKQVNSFFGDSGRGYFVWNEGTSLVADSGAARSTDGQSWSDLAGFPMWDIWFSQSYRAFMALSDTHIDDFPAYPTTTVGAGNLPKGQGQILGEMNSPIGGYVGVYFIKAGKLYYWYKDNVGVEFITEAVIGNGFNIGGGCFFNGALYVHDGQAIKSYSVSSFSEVLRDVGFQNFRSIPAHIRSGFIRAMCSDENNLYVGVQAGTDVFILAYNGRGWSIHGTIPDFYIQNMDISRIPPSNWPSTKRSLYIMGAKAQVFSQIARPNSAGNDQGQNSGTYLDIDEETADENDTSIIFTNGGNLRHSWRAQAIGENGLIQAGSVTITTIRLIARARRNSSNSANMKLFYHDGSYNDGSTKSVSSNSYSNFTQEWTGSWAAIDVNSFDFGIQFVQSSTNPDVQLRCTQMYVQYLYAGNIELWEMHLPAAGSTPTAGVDRFAQEWSLTTGWMDGGFIDLRGTLYSFLASGEFTATEYIDVSYQIDDDESVYYTLGRISENGQKLQWGKIHKEGIPFRSFRLKLVGTNGVPDVKFPSQLGMDIVYAAGPEVEQALGNASTTAQIAQSFIASGSGTVQSVKIYLKKVGTGGGSSYNLKVSILGNSAGSPNISDVKVTATTAIINDYLDTDYGWRTFMLNGGTLVEGTTYWIVITIIHTATGNPLNDASNYLRLAALNSGFTYADGEAKSYNGTVWSALNNDLVFEVNMNRTATSDLRGFVVNYNKRPKFRTQFQAPIDVQGMIDDGVPVNGEPATYESIFSKLVELWNSETLLHYVIPGVRQGHCMVAAMPVSITDVGDENGRTPSGMLSLQILDPTHSHSEV